MDTQHQWGWDNVPGGATKPIPPEMQRGRDGSGNTDRGPLYMDPYPLSASHFLVAFNPRDRWNVLNAYGLYLIDGKVVALTSIPIVWNPVAVGGEPGNIEPEGIESGSVDVIRDDVDPIIGMPIGGPDEPVSSLPPIEYVLTRPATVVTVIDVSVPEKPSLLSQTKFEGSLSSSRMTNGILRVVVSNYQNYYIDVLPMLGRPELDLAGVKVATVLPKFSRISADGSQSDGMMLDWMHVHRPPSPNGFGVVTVLSIDIDENGEAFDAVGILAEPGLIYSSVENLYLTDPDYHFDGSMRETTDVYKIAYVDGGAEPVAVGTIPGRILNQYSMGEYDGYLRVATTIGPKFVNGEFIEMQNGVYVLGQEETALVIVGRVEGIAPGENIRSARFLGDRGYIVTFEQIDPLFTLDLSDPSDPRIVGVLKVPGFSTYITPIDKDHILTVGRYFPETGPTWRGGVQLSIFDVSNFAKPVLAHQVILGADEGADSEAIWNPKAFTYFAQQDRLALPVSVYPTASGPELFNLPEADDVYTKLAGEYEIDLDFDTFRDMFFFGGPPITVIDPDVLIDGDGPISDGSSGEDFGQTASGQSSPGDEIDSVVDAEEDPDADGSIDSEIDSPDADIHEDFIDDVYFNDDDYVRLAEFMDALLTELTAIAPPEMFGFDGLIVYDVTAKDGFSEVGRLSTRVGPFSGPWTAFTRGVFIGDNVYAVTNNVIRVAPLADMDAAVDELLFAPVDSPFGGGGIIGLPPIAIDGPFMIDPGMGDPGVAMPGMPGIPESDLDSD
ncbi:MAG: beta-propeller domain-containing protein [Planctomycetes bacterium]|nr:beta-propeller domain-containing protein [Planctomycetota bacterium]